MRLSSPPGPIRRFKGILRIMSYMDRHEKKEFMLRQRVLIYSARGAIYRVYFDPLYDYTNTGIHSAVFIPDDFLIHYLHRNTIRPSADYGRAYIFCSVPDYIPFVSDRMSVQNRFIALILLLKADDHYILRHCKHSGSWKTSKERFLSGRDRDGVF